MEVAVKLFGTPHRIGRDDIQTIVTIRTLKQ